MSPVLRRGAALCGALALCCDVAWGQPDPAAWVELREDLARFNAALADSTSSLEGFLDEFARRRVDHERFTRRVFRDYCEETLEEYGKFMSEEKLEDFVARHEERLQGKFRAYWISALAAWLREAPIASLHLVEIDHGRSDAEVEIAAETGPGREPLSLTLKLRAEGRDWRLVDVETGGRSASELLRGRFEEILEKEYSLPVLEARMRQRPYVVLEDFSTTESGRVPEGRARTDKARATPQPYAALASGHPRSLAPPPPRSPST
ncbi:MAG: hypothetical protein OXH50_20885, partial [Gemmatimonadetes bacterium]|nr:hypothetical protein [Gemmatimonadota bacterium]